METGRRQYTLTVVAHALTLVAGFLVLLYCNRDQWFFFDEWEFLGGHRGVLRADRTIWEPHNEHWSTVPILIYRGLYSLYGVRTYVPYVVVLLLLHVAAAHLLWQIMRKAGVDLVLATGLCAVFLVLGAGYENLLWAFQIGFVGSVALGLAAVLLLNHDGRWGARDYGAWAVLVTALLFSSVTVTMVAVAGLTALMRRGIRHAALTVAVPAAVYGTWFILVGRDSGVTGRSTFDLFAYPGFIWAGLRAAADQAVGFPGAGALVVLALGAFLLRRGNQSDGPAAPAFACALGAVLLLALIALGRAAMGVEQAEASRFTYIVVALALPGIGLALTELTGTGVGRRLVTFGLLLLVGLHNGGLLRDNANDEKRREQRAKARLLYAAELLSSPAVILGGHPETRYSPDVEVVDIRRMARDGKLPSPTGITLEDRVSVASHLQIAVNPVPLPIPVEPAAIDGVVGATDVRTPDGCMRVFPASGNVEVHFTGGRPMSVRLTTEVDAELSSYLRIFRPRMHTGEPRRDQVRARVPAFLNVTAEVDQVVLRLPPTGTTEVCGVLWVPPPDARPAPG